jgi:hypothetical protein
LQIATNGFGLAESGGQVVQMFSFKLIPNRNTNVQFTTVAPLRQTPVGG